MRWQEIHRVHQHQGGDGEQVGKIGPELCGGFQFGMQRCRAAPDLTEHFFANLDGALGPAMLLRLESVHVRRQFRGDDDVIQINEAPALQLGAVGEVEILRQRIMLPATSVLNGGAAPEAGGAVEITKLTPATAGGLLQHEMTIQQDGLKPREQ